MADQIPFEIELTQQLADTIEYAVERGELSHVEINRVVLPEGYHNYFDVVLEDNRVIRYFAIVAGTLNENRS